MDHLSEVLIHSWHLRSRWDYIGLELGVDAGTLDSIRKINPDDPDAWFIGMIQQWLQSTKPDPTLAQLDKALNAKSVVGKHVLYQNTILASFIPRFFSI